MKKFQIFKDTAKDSEKYLVNPTKIQLNESKNSLVTQLRKFLINSTKQIFLLIKPNFV